MKRYKILIFIEVDVVVRHFIDSDAFVHLAEHHDVRFVFPELGHKRIKDIDPSAIDLPAPYQHLKTNPVRNVTWKWLYLVEQLRLRPGTQAAALRRLHRSTLGWKAATLLTFAGLPGLNWAFNFWINNRLRLNPCLEMENILDKEYPDLIMHPCVLEGIFLNDLIEQSQLRSLPLVVIMNSWDNPSTKRAMVGSPDWLLVWGEQTWHHAIKLAKTIPEKTIKFGAAQFDVFRNPPRITRAEFCFINGIKNHNKILLYAGSSKGTDEIAHLTQLDLAIENGELPIITILYRPHPWGGGGKGGERILNQKWKNIVIEQSMRSYLKDIQAGKTGKFLANYSDVHDVLCHIDALLTPLSTILIESIMHGKPALCFIPFEDKSAHFRNDLRLMHFHDIFNCPDILVAVGYEQLVPRTLELLGRIGDTQLQQRLIAYANYFVEPHDKPFNERITSFVEGVLSEKCKDR